MAVSPQSVSEGDKGDRTTGLGTYQTLDNTGYGRTNRANGVDIPKDQRDGAPRQDRMECTTLGNTRQILTQDTG